jgi:GYD domain
MPTFLITSNLTEQGSRNVKEVPKRVAASREAAKKFGVEIKQIYMTAGEAEFLVIVESPSISQEPTEGQNNDTPYAVYSQGCLAALTDCTANCRQQPPPASGAPNANRERPE